jgi:hypothetical protein
MDRTWVEVIAIIVVGWTVLGSLSALIMTLYLRSLEKPGMQVERAQVHQIMHNAGQGKRVFILMSAICWPLAMFGKSS